MPRFFIAGIVLFLLLSAGYALTQAARSIPWDCSDWQAFAHSDRTTAILESLADNRGKTLYCGIDQSDTFAKAETWQAGKDRNERDDTVYFGERGSFRGFIAAQEGWLTEGESGITGQSIATIFEFPREKKKRRRKKYQYLRDVVTDRATVRMWSEYGPPYTAATNLVSEINAQNLWIANPPTDAELLRLARSAGALIIDAADAVYATDYPSGLNEVGGLDAFCRRLGYQRSSGVEVTLRPDHAGTSWSYIQTRDGANYVNRARRAFGLRADCLRRR